MFEFRGFDRDVMWCSGFDAFHEFAVACDAAGKGHLFSTKALLIIYRLLRMFLTVYCSG